MMAVIAVLVMGCRQYLYEVMLRGKESKQLAEGPSATQSRDHMRHLTKRLQRKQKHALH